MRESVCVQGDIATIHDLKIRPAAYVTGDRFVERMVAKKADPKPFYIWAKIPSRVEKVLTQGYASGRETEIKIE